MGRLKSTHNSMAVFRIFSAVSILSGVSGSVCSPSMYWPGFSNCTRKAPAMDAIGQPWLRLGVFWWSLLAIAQAFLWSSPRMAAAAMIRMPVKREGM